MLFLLAAAALQPSEGAHALSEQVGTHHATSDKGQIGGSKAETMPPARQPVISSLAHKADADDEKRQRRSEIDAQWVSARAGESAARAAWVFGWSSLLVGITTLGAAAAAAIYAKKSADESRRSANYAQRSYSAFTQVEDASLIVSMPSGREITGSVHTYMMDCFVTNVGRSAAKIIAFQLEGDDPLVVDQTVSPGETFRLPKVQVTKVDRVPSIAKGTIRFASALHSDQNHDFSGGILVDRDKPGQAFAILITQGKRPLPDA